MTLNFVNSVAFIWNLVEEDVLVVIHIYEINQKHLKDKEFFIKISQKKNPLEFNYFLD